MHFIKHHSIVLLITLSFALLRCAVLHAQSPDFRFKSIFKEDGLSSNTINGVVKDKLGFLWIATNSGLCRYDAKGRMKVFQADAENNRLHSSNIQFIYTDSKGFLWIGTRHGGLTKIDVATDVWKTYRHNPEDDNSLAHDEILCITEDTEGRIWIGTENGLNIFYPEEEHFETFRVNEADPTALRGKSVLSFLQDKKGLMWVGTWGGGLHLFLPDKNNIAKSTFRNFMIPEKNAHRVIWEIYQDKGGRYWIGEEFGLTYMQVPTDASDEVSKQNWNLNFHTYQEKDRLNTRQVFSILSDSRGNLWVSSIQGLNLIRKEFLPDTTIFLKSTADKPNLQIQNFRADEGNVFSISSNDVFYIYEDEQELIWIGTSKGLNQFNWRSRQFEFIEMAEGSKVDASIIIPEGILFSIDESPYMHIYDLKKDTIIKSFKSAQNRIDKKGFINFRNHKGDTICTLTDDGIGVYNIKTDTYLHQLVFDDNRQYFDDAFISDYMFYQDKIWIGTSKGLTVFDTKRHQLKNYNSNLENKQSLINTAISDIEFDNEGNLWVSTWGGLSVMSKAQVNQPTLPDEFKFENYEVENTDGFISNKIVMLKNAPKRMYMGTGVGMMSYEYESGKFVDRTKGEYRFWVHSIDDWTENEVWMSTEEGIINYNAKTESYKIYHSDYGINNASLRHSKNYKDEKGRLYFTGGKTIIRLAPDELLKNETPPIVSITDARILNTQKEESFSTINAEEIELQYGDYLLALSFSVLNYDSPEKNQYAYRLEGFDENWTYTKSTEPIVYTNLDAGNYTFRVKAANNDGVWNKEGASLDIVKKPAFWETKLFIAALILLTILGIALSVRSYNRRLVRRYKEIESYNKKLNTEITERKKAEQTLQIKNKELISTNKDLEQFAYICSHDLKEPIQGVQSFTNLIERKIINDPLKKETAPYFKYTYNYLKTLQNIITSLGVYTSTNNAENFIRTPILLSDVFRKVEANLLESIREKNAVLHFTDSTAGKVIYYSEYALGLVLQNLVQNGIKYNRSKPPKVSINVILEDEELRFTIRDNGIGIKERHFDYIFRPFKTLENKNKTNSSGLGLSICARIINQLGGKIWVESTFGEGSTFHVALEHDEVAEPALQEEQYSG